MRDEDYLLMTIGVGLVIFVSMGLVIDHGYTVYKIAECKNKAIEHNMPYLEINEVCR
jgi:hypothetical protein